MIGHSPSTVEAYGETDASDRSCGQRRLPPLPPHLLLNARYVPRRLVPGLVASTALAAPGVVTALAGVSMGWILAAFMLWSVANTLTKLRRRDPVVTLDAPG